jgi:hypothetical protein
MNLADPTTYAAIFAAAVAVVVAVATGFKDVVVAFFRRWAKSIEKGKRDYTAGVKRITDFHECLERIGRLDFVDRVLIFTGTNCGGVPDPKKPYIVRCFYGWSADPSKHPEQNYNFNLKVDAHYMHLICEIISKGMAEVHTETMPTDSQLRSYYSTEGVHSSRLYSLYLDEISLIYASVASYKREFTAAESARVNQEIDRIRDVLHP